MTYRARYLAALCRINAIIERLCEEAKADLREQARAAIERINRSAGQYIRRANARRAIMSQRRSKEKLP